ncbi:hypothetical protein [Massilia sp. Leaf139]|uniref:hypothetical protein n=1 Tax=Massilia sp. Leaf139 TaxID=1736272 RepID=UPI000B2BBC99|nr:hypothetical protein [Massilia sp. Leaf139]
MLETIALQAQLIGLVMLGFGYRKSSESIMLGGALCLLLGGGIPDFVAGFIDGLNAAA